MQQAQVARRKYQSAISSVNRVLEILERNPQLADKAFRISELRRHIRELSRGDVVIDAVPSSKEGDVLNLVEGANEDHSLGVIARRVGKRLLSKCHPDKGGDVELYLQVLAAMKAKDIAVLTYLQITVTDTANLYWRQEEGISFWKEQESIFKSRYSVVRSNPLGLIASLYVVGKPDDAVSAYGLYLDKALEARRVELNDLIRRSHGQSRKVEEGGRSSIQEEGQEGRGSEDQEGQGFREGREGIKES